MAKHNPYSRNGSDVNMEKDPKGYLIHFSGRMFDWHAGATGSFPEPCIPLEVDI